MNAMNPLPSLIRASAWDAANMAMRKDGRTKWSEDDYNLACETQERLIRSTYSRAGDNDDRLCYIRFSFAEAMEKARLLTLYTKDFFGVLDRAFAEAA